MIYYKTEAEIEIMRQSALLGGKAIAEVAKLLKPGITTGALDKIAEEFLRDNGATPSFKNYKGYPYASCISVNDAVVHGFPNGKELEDGDVISVDFGAFKNNYH